MLWKNGNQRGYLLEDNIDSILRDLIDNGYQFKKNWSKGNEIELWKAEDSKGQCFCGWIKMEDRRRDIELVIQEGTQYGGKELFKVMRKYLSYED